MSIYQNFQWRKILLTSLFLIGTMIGQETTPTLSIDNQANTAVSLWWSNLFPDYVIERSDNLGNWKMPVDSHEPVSQNFEYLESIQPGKKFFRLRQQVTAGPDGAVNYLISTQQDNGLWTLAGDDSVPATISVLGALTGQSLTDLRLSRSLNLASAGLQDLRPENHDELARLIIALGKLGVPSERFVSQLLEGQNPVSRGSNPNSSQGGWGLLPGFSDSNLDTALALRALHEAEAPMGAAVSSLIVPAGGESERLSFSVPAGATDLTLRVDELSTPVQVLIARPNLGESFVDLTPGGVPVSVNLGAGSPGQWSIRARSPGAGGTISFSVGYLTADGIDANKSAAAIGALLNRQNADGGWGIANGQASNFFATYVVTETIAEVSPGSTTALSSAGTWVETNFSLADGGFSSDGPSSTAFETAQGALILKRNDLRNPRLASARSRLHALQLPNGSWESDPRITALALSALLSPPEVSTIPGQTVTDPQPFATIQLGDFVDDPAYPDSEIQWTVQGDIEILVDIFNGVATLRYNVNDFTGEFLPPLTAPLVDTMTFIAKNPDGLSNGVEVTFTVNPGGGGGGGDGTPLARGATLSGTAVITGTEAVLDQIAQYSIKVFPPGADVTYTATAVARTNATTFEVSWEVTAAAGAALGPYSFTATHTFFDGASNPVTPVNGGVLEFDLEITP